MNSFDERDIIAVNDTYHFNSVPHTHETNAIAESMIGVMRKCTRVHQLEGGFPPVFAPTGAIINFDIRNDIISEDCNTSRQKFAKINPDFTFMIPPGCAGYTIDFASKTKSDATGIFCISLGHAMPVTNQRGYLVYIPKTHQITTVVTARFNLQKKPFIEGMLDKAIEMVKEENPRNYIFDNGTTAGEFVGREIAKYFKDPEDQSTKKLFYGNITDVQFDHEHKPMFRVIYDDDYTEDMYHDEMLKYLIDTEGQVHLSQLAMKNIIHPKDDHPTVFRDVSQAIKLAKSQGREDEVVKWQEAQAREWKKLTDRGTFRWSHYDPKVHEKPVPLTAPSKLKTKPDVHGFDHKVRICARGDLVH
mmetsp:Transcript_36964/g.92848  ORF Transcript_36964/g.92848 Transcript_36964/m.92848 type:complete len:360 (-) Transcript_36964:295-1374(-)